MRYDTSGGCLWVVKTVNIVSYFDAYIHRSQQTSEITGEFTSARPWIITDVGNGPGGTPPAAHDVAGEVHLDSSYSGAPSARGMI